MNSTLRSALLAGAGRWLGALACAQGRSRGAGAAQRPRARAGVSGTDPRARGSIRRHLEVAELAGGLEHPWGMALLPDGAVLVTERPGRMRIVAADGSVSEPLAGLPAVHAGSRAACSTWRSGRSSPRTGRSTGPIPSRSATG